MAIRDLNSIYEYSPLFKRYSAVPSNLNNGLQQQADINQGLPSFLYNRTDAFASRPELMSPTQVSPLGNPLDIYNSPFTIGRADNGYALSRLSGFPTVKFNTSVQNPFAPKLPDYYPEAKDSFDTTPIESVGPLTEAAINGNMKQFLSTNPVKKGLSAGAKNAIAAGIGLAGSIGGNAIAGGYDDGGVGKTIAGVGSAVGSIASLIPGVGTVAGAAIGAGAKLLGGLYTRGFGVERNEKNIAAVNSNIDNMKATGNLLASANTHAGVLGAATRIGGPVDFTNSAIAHNGLFNSKGDAIANNLRNSQNTALAMQGQGLATGVKNADLEQKNRTANSFIAAYGGGLTRDNGMGAIDYGFMSDLLANKRKQLEVKDRLPGMTGIPSTLNMFGSGGNLFELGGPDDGLVLQNDNTYVASNPANIYVGKMVAGTPSVRDQMNQNVTRERQIANNYLQSGPSLGNLARAAYHGLRSVSEHFRDPNPNLVTGVAPTPGKLYGSPKSWTELGSRLAKERNLSIISGANGKNYVKLANGKVKSLESFGRDEMQIEEAALRSETQNMAKYYREHPEAKPSGNAYKSSPLKDPAVNLNATRGSINSAKKGRVSNRGAITVDDIYKAYGGPLFALGGDLQSHGADWSNGLTFINAGGTHEGNPNEGVQVGVDPQGTPNLVEEGETIYNDYVYSKRIYADGGALRQFHISPKRKITYADLAKRLQKEAEERPNDPISQAALKSQMADLAEHQERQKVEMQAEEAKAAFESLSPEEQVALMQQAEAQEQQAAEEEAAMQEQAMAEQQMQGQPSEEEMMMQQQMMAQQGGMPSQTGQPEVISAYGGPINRFDDGGSKYDMEALIKAITEYQKGKFNLGKYKNIKDYENSDEYKAFTKEVLDYINSNPSFTTVSAIQDPRQQMLVRYLNELSGRGNDRLFGRAEDGSYKFLPNAAETYQRLREDGRAGIYHLNPALMAEAAADASTTPTVASTADTPTTAAAAVAPAASATTITDAQRDNIRNSILKSLGISTVGDLQKWAKDNKVSDFDDYDKIDWGNIRSNKSFMDALAKSNSDLAHVINTGGYDFGIYQPTATDNGIQSINRGNWNTSGSKKSGLVPGLIKGWEGSTDAMWQEVKDKIKPDMSLEDVEKLMKNTEAYKKTTEWLKSSPDNMLAYLQAIEDSGDAAPESARRHYMFDEKGNPRNWVEKGEDGKLRWKEGYTPKYEDIFGVVRDTYPGSYWHTHSAAMRNPVTVNYVQKEDGSWDKVIGDVGNDWEKINSYSWYGKDDNNDYTYNYYKNPNVKAADAAKKEGEKKWQDDYDVLPIHRNDKLRYAGLFGPAVGLGLMAAGVGRPDASGLDVAVNAYSNRGSYLPSVRYTDGYYAYRPENPFIGDIAADNASAGTARAITNTTAPYGAQQASLLANAYNDQLARGTRIAQGRQYNNQERLQALNAYKNTDQFNAQAFNANEGVRAQILNQDRQTLANMRMNAAQQKMAADAGWYNSLYGNVSGLFKGISDLGRENAQHNMIADMAANGIFGTLTPNSPIATDFLKWQKKSGVTAEGGKINRKKNKRRGGLTY